MKPFRGFPSRAEFTSVPNALFSELLPRIDDLAELRVTLLAIAALYRKKGAPRFLGRGELLADAAVAESLRDLGKDLETTLADALDKAAGRGTLIALVTGEGRDAETIYLLNDEPGRQAAAKVAAGQLTIKGKKATLAPLTPVGRSDIIATYEDAIGLCDPSVLNALREAERRYPADWITDAIREAGLRKARSVREVMKILEAWAVEAAKDGTYQRDTEKTDPDRYVGGEFGHVVKR